VQEVNVRRVLLCSVLLIFPVPQVDEFVLEVRLQPVGVGAVAAVAAAEGAQRRRQRELAQLGEEEEQRLTAFFV
jgi:hypothetical protein